MAAERGKSGVIDVGSTLLVIGDDDHVGDRNLTTAGSVAFRDLAPGGRYDVLLCTESTSGSLSEVTSSVEVGVYPKAPEVGNVTNLHDRNSLRLEVAFTTERDSCLSS